MIKAQVALRKLAEINARSALKANPTLWAALQDYLEKTKSTGCGLSDYHALYQEIRSRRPMHVLECGTGVSTLVIAQALRENEAETGRRGHVTSMEEYGEWLEMSRGLLPEVYHDFVDFQLSDTVEDQFSLFRGVRYRDIPARPYDFVFVDGPKYHSPLDGTPTFDFDFLHVLRTADHEVSGLIDKRVSTCFVLQQILGRTKLRYDPVRHLGFIAPCTKHSLGQLQADLSSLNFEPSLRALANARLSMTPLLAS